MSPDQRTPGDVVDTKPLKLWALHCPFRKTGSPVLGTFGRTIRPVVIMEMATWNRLCQEVPALQHPMNGSQRRGPGLD